MTSMITTCPDCRTVFRIKNEQLAARDGRVRCGQCSAVFDAREALQIESLKPAPESGGSQENSPSHAEVVAFPKIEQSPVARTDAQDTATREAVSATVAHVLTAETPAVPVPAVHETESVLPATAPLRARRRAGWAAGSALLILALMTQIAFHYRGEIAIVFPETRLALVELCANLGCGVPLPRRADMISIESSDLQADPANSSVMVLTATLRNRASFAQAHPSLELTLTDTRDQPLARRVLGAQDYLGPSTSIEAGFTANSELSIKTYIEASSLKATGYRLYLFFP